MSSYIVEDKTINRIITAITDAQAQYPTITFMTGLKFPKPNSFQKFGQKMMAMNIKATEERYGEDDKFFKKEKRYADYKFQYENAKLIQVLKSLGCFLYQCSEGNVPKMKLYRQLREVEIALTAHIVQNLPEYDAAKWG